MADEHRDQEGRGQADEPQDRPEEQSAAQDQGEKSAKQEGEQERDLEAEIEELQARLVHANEEVLRAQADAQNALRRAERDVEKAHKFGQEKLVSDLLAVVDNLERALGAVSEPNDESVKAIVEGVELTHKGLVDTLRNHKVEQIDPQGEPFDPELHQAMTTTESREVEPNTVLEVFQKGYTLHGRLVRPAMVVVSKAPVEA
ncbi:nucleotide exchange factor GrpE [Gilvimarinus sp. F26214L]|uniref:nucleotide exchange factor GrpE n=1 Tax=Gilvimarinus sp. DZF01 TaxID=3461371 RepID=UPI004045AD98